jgi:hypothetical protein
MNAPKPTLKQRAYHGIKAYLALTCYLWIVLALFVLYKSVILAEHNIAFAANGFALINALALAKVMLLAQELHMAEQLKEAPLIYATLFKSAAFGLVLGCFKIFEEALMGLYHGKTFSESIAGIGGGTFMGILSLMAILSVLLVPFFAITELGGVIGEEKLKKIFFNSRRPAGAQS